MKNSLVKIRHDITLCAVHRRRVFKFTRDIELGEEQLFLQLLVSPGSFRTVNNSREPERDTRASAQSPSCNRQVGICIETVVCDLRFETPRTDFHGDIADEEFVSFVEPDAPNMDDVCDQATYMQYNKFFNPNLCHVCKRSFAGILILCEYCCMISYCSKYHQISHLAEHLEICKSIRKFLTTAPTNDTRCYRPREWMELKQSLVDSVMLDLNRELQPYESQMLMYRRSCLVCHRQADLQVCENCRCADFCCKHAAEFQRRHFCNCMELLLMVNLDIAIIKDPAVMPQLQFTDIPNDRMPYCDMYSFVSKYVQSARSTKGTGNTWNITDFIYTDYVSGPLTLYHGMQDANLLHKLKVIFTVQIIAASEVDIKGMAAWELFLHLAPNVEVLKIILIGPEIPMLHCGVIDICTSCQLRERKLRYECYPMLYPDYVISQFYNVPDIIVGFQVELPFSKTWPVTIRQLFVQTCPIFLTATSLTNAQNDMDEIQEALNTIAAPDFICENQFAACRPYKELRYDCVCYRNKFLTVYSNIAPLQ